MHHHESRWTHPICESCYEKFEPGRNPFRVIDRGYLKCCFCQKTTDDGIFYRFDPEHSDVNCEIPEHATIGDKYNTAMHLEDQGEADHYFKQLVRHNMANTGHDQEEAERVERSNLGYYAGYSSDETRERVERLFKTKHPYFGSIAEKGPPTAKEAFELGEKWGDGERKEHEGS